MNYARAPWLQMLRGPMVYYAPDPPAGGEGEEDPPAGEGEEDPPGEGGEDDPPAGEGDPPAGEGDGEGEPPAAAAGGGEDDDTPAPRRAAWPQRRIGQLTAKVSEAEAERDRLRTENAALRALSGNDTTAAPAGGGEAPRTYTEDEVNTRAAAIAAANVLNVRVDAVYDEALAADTRLADAMPEFREAVGDQLKMRPDFFEALVELPNAAAVLIELVKDPDEAVKLVEMSPAKMGVALASRSAKLLAAKKPPRISGAPPPPRPINTGGGTRDLPLDDPKVSMEEYARRRAAEREERRNNGAR